jgi:hypothetical protein
MKTLKEYVPMNVDLVSSELREGVHISKAISNGCLASNIDDCKDLFYNVLSSKHALVEAMQEEGIRRDTISMKMVCSLSIKASASIGLSMPCMPRKLESFKSDSSFVSNATCLWKMMDETAHLITWLSKKHGYALQYVYTQQHACVQNCTQR